MKKYNPKEILSGVDNRISTSSNSKDNVFDITRQKSIYLNKAEIDVKNAEGKFGSDRIERSKEKVKTMKDLKISLEDFMKKNDKSVSDQHKDTWKTIKNEYHDLFENENPELLKEATNYPLFGKMTGTGQGKRRAAEQDILVGILIVQEFYAKLKEDIKKKETGEGTSKQSEDLIKELQGKVSALEKDIQSLTTQVKNKDEQVASSEWQIEKLKNNSSTDLLIVNDIDFRNDEGIADSLRESELILKIAESRVREARLRKTVFQKWNDLTGPQRKILKHFLEQTPNERLESFERASMKLAFNQEGQFVRYIDELVEECYPLKKVCEQFTTMSRGSVHFSIEKPVNNTEKLELNRSLQEKLTTVINNYEETLEKCHRAFIDYKPIISALPEYLIVKESEKSLLENADTFFKQSKKMIDTFIKTYPIKDTNVNLITLWKRSQASSDSLGPGNKKGLIKDLSIIETTVKYSVDYFPQLKSKGTTLLKKIYHDDFSILG